MINILVLSKQNDVLHLIKKEIHSNIGGNIYIRQVWKLDELKDDRTKYLFIIVDINSYGIINNKMKLQERWKNSYYIYLSHDRLASFEAIGFNVIGYITYNKLGSIGEFIKNYLQMIHSTYDCYFKTENGIEAYKFDEIIYFEMINRKVKMQTKDELIELINYKLIDIYNILDNHFNFINKSIIINHSYIRKMTNDKTILIHYELINREFKLSKTYIKNYKLNKKSASLDKIKQN